MCTTYVLECSISLLVVALLSFLNLPAMSHYQAMCAFLAEDLNNLREHMVQLEDRVLMLRQRMNATNQDNMRLRNDLRSSRIELQDAESNIESLRSIMNGVIDETGGELRTEMRDIFSRVALNLGVELDLSDNEFEIETIDEEEEWINRNRRET